MWGIGHVSKGVWTNPTHYEYEYCLTVPSQAHVSPLHSCQRGCLMIRVDPVYTTALRQPWLSIWHDTWHSLTVCGHTTSFLFSLSSLFFSTTAVFCFLSLSLVSCNISVYNKLKNKNKNKQIVMLSGTRDSTSHTPSDSPWPSDLMVKVELEAAEALACLAHSSAVIETRATKSVSCRRVKNESLVAEQDSASHPIELVPPSSYSSSSEVGRLVGLINFSFLFLAL